MTETWVKQACQARLDHFADVERERINNIRRVI